MAGNRQAREQLYTLYGKKCMLCGYRPRHSFTSKKKDRNPLTYHHIVEKSNGGQSTVENGAILCNKCHVWFHKQSKLVQKELNKFFQDYKAKHKKWWK